MSKTETVEFAGVLFDMDGTLIDSTPAVKKHWHQIGKEMGIDPEIILKTSHGRRSIDTFKELDPTRANWEYVKEVEGRLPKLYGEDGKELPGAKEIIATFNGAGVPWAVVTSGTVPLVEGWLEVLKIKRPSVLVTAEDVAEGKPDPSCYKLGKSKLGLAESSSVLVVEDAPAGIKAGKAAGCKVVGLLTSHTEEQVRAAGPDWVVKDLSDVQFEGFNLETRVVTLSIKYSP